MTPRRLFALALAAWLVVVALGLVLGAPLSPDECAYALLARGVDVDWLYRPRGMVALAELGVALGGSDLAMRLAPALASLAFVAAVAAVGRRAFGAWVGAWATALVVGAHAFVLRAPDLLGDLPAATCLLAALAVVLDELPRDDGPRYRLVVVAPLLAAAFYLRYGSAPMIAMLAVVALVAWWRTARARPGPIVATAALLCALLAPHALASRAATGSITGILVLSNEVASRDPLGTGLRELVLANPFQLYGALVPVAVVAGLAALTAPAPGRRRTTWVLGALALGQIIAIGLVGHGAPRYIFFALALLCILGVDGLVRATRGRRAAAPVAGLVLAGAWLVLVCVQPTLQGRLAGNVAALTADAAAIRADAAGRPCVIAALSVPQLMWYAGCSGVKLGAPGTRVDLPADRRWYAASTPNRPIDPAVVAGTQGAEPLALPSPSAWYLRPR